MSLERLQVNANSALFLATLLVVCVATFAAVSTHDFTLGIDDAHISLVYASNLAHGHGFVYNIGGERVEGFSTLLWVLLTAPAFYLPGRPETWILGLSTLLTTLSYAIGARLLIRAYTPVSSQVPPILVAALFVGLLVLWPAQVTWMTASLMETSLWSVLLTAAAVLLLSNAEDAGRKHAGVFSAVMALMLLTRPEALLVVPTLLLLRLVRVAGFAGWRLALRRTMVPMLVTAASAAALTIFRLLYFGYPLPNTYYAKVSPHWQINLGEGLSYLNSFVSAGPLLVLIFFLNVTVLTLAAVLVARSLKRGTLSELVGQAFSRDAVVLSLFSSILLIVPVINGGDHFKWWRMYQPAYPVLLLTVFLLARDGVASSRLRSTPATRVALTAIVLLFGMFRLYDPVTWFKVRTESPVAREFRLGRDGIQGGALLTMMFSKEPRLPSVAVVAAGGIKRSYAGEVQDLMGLNSIAMAHSGGDRTGIINHAAFDKAVFFDRLPEIVWPTLDPSPPSVRTRDFFGFVLHGLPNDPLFLERYKEATLYCKATGERGLTAYFRKDFMDRLSSDSTYLFTTVGKPAQEAEAALVRLSQRVP